MNVSIKTTHFDSCGKPTRAKFTVDGKKYVVVGTPKIRAERSRVQHAVTKADKKAKP